MTRRTVMICLVMIVGAGVVSAQQSPPGAATGAKIGNTIKAAVETAFPPVGELLKLIWPNRADGTPRPEAKRTEVEAALNAQRTQLLQAAQAKVKPVDDLVKELTAVNGYLEPTVVAQQSLAKISTTLVSATPDWNLIDVEWKIARTNLEGLKALADARISNLWLRNVLHKIQQTLKTQVIRVDSKVSGRDVAGLRVELEALSQTVGDVPAAVGYEIADPRDDLAELAKWARGEMGGAEARDVQQVYKRHLDDRYN